jgi:hypothetical protein
VITVESWVRVRESNGIEAPLVGAGVRYINVKSHWNMDRLVVLQVDGIEYTIVASDLHAAINNATNSNRSG